MKNSKADKEEEEEAEY